MLASVLDLAADLISLHDPDGTTRHASYAAWQVLGVDPAQITGRPAAEFVYPDDRLMLADAAGQALRDGASRVSFRSRRADDELRWLETSLRAVEGQLVAVSRDVTERRT